MSKIISYRRFLWPEISTNKTEMFGTEQQNSINPAVHIAGVPTEIHTQIKITITKKESIKVEHLVFFSATITCPYLCQADKN